MTLNIQNPKAVGERSEAMILARLLCLGYAVSLPFGNNQRYDMIVDDGERLWKAQCKTGRLIQGCVSFAVASKNGFTNVRRAYHNDVDMFLIYSPDLEKTFRVPIEIAPSNEMRLRVDALRTTAPTSTIKWAKDFELKEL